MSTILSALNTAQSALTADQIALQTIDHNVANANTPGYSQQTAHQVASPAYTVPSLLRPAGAGQIGTGVTVSTITRTRDALMDGEYRYQNQFSGQWQTLDTHLDQVQSVFTDTSSTGLGSLLTQFYTNWQSVADDPSNVGARGALQQTGIALATAFNNDAQQLSQAQQQADTAAQTAVTDINNVADQIANLNGQIQAVVASGQQPNDLMDRRDQLLDQLAQDTPITYATQPDGTVTVSLATQVPGTTTLQAANPTETPLVQGSTANHLTISAMGLPTYAADGKPYVDPAVIAPTPPATAAAPVGGKLGAALQLRDKILGGSGGLMTKLDNIANALAVQVQCE